MTIDPLRPPVSSSSAHTASAQTSPRSIDFRFHGKGFEYFKIWIVNILLTVITLGIYSAWAKVRNKQYFYGNTELDGASFSYDAKPIKILKGRMIAMGVIALLSFVSALNPFLAIIVPLAFIPLMPFFIQRALMFNARYSSYRNVRFGFTGTLKAAMMVFVGWPVLLVLIIVVINLLLVVMGLPEDIVGAISMLIYFVVLLPFMFYHFKSYVIANSLYGTSPFRFGARVADFIAVFVLTFGLGLLILLLGAFLVQFLSGSVIGDLGEMLQGDMDPEAMATMFVPLVLTVIFFGAFVAVVPYAFYVAKINNLVFNRSSLADFEFRATFTTLSYARLHFVNTLLTLLTLGLFWPFAKVRTARYKAEHTKVLALTSLDQFVVRQEQEVGALGEAVGDFYDLDFGI